MNLRRDVDQYKLVLYCSVLYTVLLEDDLALLEGPVAGRLNGHVLHHLPRSSSYHSLNSNNYNNNHDKYSTYNSIIELLT